MRKHCSTYTSKDKGDASGWLKTPNSGESETRKSKRKHKQDDSIVPRVNHVADLKLQKKMEAFNAASRGQSLMEEHKQAQPEKEGPKGFSWNRERDMAFSKVDKKHNDKIVKGADDLQSRFARPGSSRQFL